MRLSLSLSFVFSVCLSVLISHGVFGAEEVAAPQKKKAKYEPAVLVPQDLPLIACDLCNLVSLALVSHVDMFAESIDPLPLREMHVVEIIENVCKPTNATGHWLREIDIVEAAHLSDPETGAESLFLDFAFPGTLSKINSETVTLAKSCSMLLDEIDVDDLSAFLYKHRPTVPVLQEKLCLKMTKRCHGSKKPLPKSYKRKDTQFVQVTEQDLKMEELVAKMQAMGMRGSLKDRSEIDKMLEDIPHERVIENDDDEDDEL